MFNNMEVMHDRIEAIRDSGASLGLTDRQIDNCILDALKEFRNASKPVTETRTRKPSRCRRICRIALIGAAIWVAFVAVVIGIISASPDCQQWLRESADPWIYPVTKNWRLLTLGVNRKFDLSEFYNSECMIRNPFAAIQNVDCEACSKVAKEHVLNTVTSRQYENIYMGKAQPLILKNVHPKVTFDALRSWYRDNGVTFESWTQKLQKAPSGVKTIDAFLANYTEEDILANPHFQLEWSSEGVNPSRLLRKLFPRQDFIPHAHEVNLRKTLMVLAPEAGPDEPDTDRRSSPAQWYVQGSGSREIKLKPYSKCDTCKSFSFVLDSGDILCYNGVIYRLESLPVPGNEEINIGYIGSLMVFF